MKYYLALFILIILHILILKNLQFTAWPEMFSYPYLLNHGFNLYKDIALPYQPLLILTLSMVYKIFGYNLLTLKIFTWSLVILSDLILFLISSKLIFSKILRFAPLAFYIFIQSFTEGNMLWFDLATVPFLLTGILMLISIKGSKKYFWFGFFLSLAFFIKQQTGILVLFAMLYLLIKKEFRGFKLLSLGFLPLTFLVVFYIFYKGIFHDYFFWTITVPIYWYPKFPGYSGLPSNNDIFVIALLLLPGLIGFLKKFKKIDLELSLIFISFFGAFLAAFPRFGYFRFQPAAALYVVLFAMILSKEKLKNIIFYFTPLLISILLLFKISQPLFNLPARFFSDRDILLSKSIAETANSTDRIYILGESSLIYVLTNKLPPKPWVDNYVWYMEIDGMQERVLRGFSSDPPKFIFRKIPKNGNWYDLGVYQPSKIINFVEQNYQKKDIIEDSIEVWIRK